MVRSACRLILALCVLAGPAHSSDVKTYLYDAQGRMTASTRVVNGGTGDYRGYIFDDADNRTQRATQLAPSPAMANELQPGEIMVAGQSIKSPNGQATLILQREGNLVLYSGSVAKWSTPTIGGDSMFLGMQGDGNLVMYSPAFVPLWFQVFNQPGTRLVLQNDCNLVLYNASTPLWATGTSC